MTVDEPGTSTVLTYAELEAMELNQLVSRLTRLVQVDAELKLVINDMEKFDILLKKHKSNPEFLAYVTRHLPEHLRDEL